MPSSFQFEKLNDTISVCISDVHRFGTDAFLLANFASPKHKDTICDLGTGCGIIPMILCKRFSPKKIYGVDIQPKAIEQFRLSIKHSQLDTEVIPVEADLNNLPKDILAPTSFDIVTCNPPYKANNTGILSDLTAEQIARHEVLCTIDDVCQAGARLLRFGGKLVICQRPERLADVIEAMRKNGIEPKLLQFVAKNSKSAPWLFLIEGKKGAKPFMKVLPTFIMYSEEELSEELRQVYGNMTGNSANLE